MQRLRLANTFPLNCQVLCCTSIIVCMQRELFVLISSNAALCFAYCRTSFKDVGKGWYNLAESNFETYRFSKLCRFLGLVRFSMEDTLRFLAEGSMAKFVGFIQVGTTPLRYWSTTPRWLATLARPLRH